MSNLIIKSEKDISKIKLGDSYIVDGPEDPEEFFEFLQSIEPSIDKHIQGLLGSDNKQDIKDEFTVKELKYIATEQKIKGRSKMNEDQLIEAIDWKLVK